MNLDALGSCLTDPGCVVPRFLGGLGSAAVLYLVASGLSLVFGVMGVLNFAHGSLYMLGAYFGYSVANALGRGTVGFLLGLVAAPVLVGLVGAVMEAGFLRRIYDRELLYQLLLTFAFVLVLDDLVRLSYGVGYITPGIPPFLSAGVPVAGTIFPLYQLVLIGVAALVGIGLALFVRKTRYGMVLRATAIDPEMAGVLGVSVPRVWTSVFVLGAALGALGGALAGPLRSLVPGMGLDVIVESFLVVVIGGLGSLAGAALGAVLVGLFRAFGVIVAPGLELVFIYILVLIVLVARPRGLAGRELES